MRGYLRIVDYLVRNKADVNQKSHRKFTPLHFAAENGHINIVKYLVLNNADPKAKDEDMGFYFPIIHQSFMRIRTVTMMLLTIWKLMTLVSCKDLQCKVV